MRHRGHPLKLHACSDYLYCRHGFTPASIGEGVDIGEKTKNAIKQGHAAKWTATFGHLFFLNDGASYLRNYSYGTPRPRWNDVCILRHVDLGHGLARAMEYTW